MATVIQKNYSDIRPVKFSLRDKDRSLDLSVPAKYISQQGCNFLEYKFLTNLNDIKNKNYTTNYLTDTKSESEIFDLNFGDNINTSFITTLEFGSNKYLTISKTNTSLSATAEVAALSTGNDNMLNTQSFVVNLSTSSVNNKSVCQIWAYDGMHKKYLVQRGTNQTVHPEIIFDTLNPTIEGLGRATFDIVLDKNRLLLSLFDDTNFSTDVGVKNTQFIVTSTASILSALSGIDQAKAAAAAITISSNAIADTNYNKYSNNFVYYTSDMLVDSVSSLPEQKYNFLFYNNYESNYLSGSDIYGQVSYFNLKNQISNNNNVNKKLPFDLPQQQRYYNSILNNEIEETSEENLKLSYNLYTAEYKFDPDRYTKFTLPSNILPFKTININDANFQGAGAYAAGSPYYSDRIYKLLDETNSNVVNEENGQFLCSWLYDDGDTGVWLDRYYLPDFTTSPLSATMRGKLNTYNTSVLEISSAYGLGDTNMYYYDVRSTLALEPNNTLYYARIGKSYISKTLNGLSDRVVKTDLNLNSILTENIISNQHRITFDGTQYDKFTFPSPLDTDQGSISISFSLNTPSISATKAHQLIGNLYNTGISVMKNFYFTPFVILQNGNSLNYYDNNFNLIRSNTFSMLSTISDVCYQTQAGDAVLIGSNSDGFKILRVNYNGDVIREATHSLAQELASSEYTSRVFFGVGSRARFYADDDAYNMDLQTLQIDKVQSVNGESAILSAVGTDIAEVSGLKGVNIDGKYAASLSAATGPGASDGTAVLFTEYSTNNQFRAINALADRIWDINAYDDKLYIQSDKLYVFNTDRELLSAISLSTRAVSGYKIDFISEDYAVNPIVFSRDINNNLIVDKIITTENNTVSTYSLGIPSIDLGHPTSPIAGNFVSPTNLHSLEDTFRTYEDKFCFVSRFDNEIAKQNKRSPWDTYTPVWSAFQSGHWNVDYTGTGETLIDNSSVHIINGIRNGHNCVQIDLDLITGKIRILVNGEETTTFTINAGIKPLKNYLYNDFYIGVPNFSTGSIIDYKSKNVSLARNAIIGHLNVFDTTLDTDILKYLYLDCVSEIDPVNFDVTTSARNNVETINNFYSYKIPGNLSNKIKLLIKNGNLNLKEQAIITETLRKKITKFLPASININDIDFDFRIGNDQPADEPVPLLLQPSLPITGAPFSNVFDPGSFISVEVSTFHFSSEPILFDRDGVTSFIMVI
tara:strand:- start:4082 stop:7705 length:3624 start_codon:yes stop_codon:yes gene_type:complete